MTPVVFVCSPLMVATAKGSGKPTGRSVDFVRRQAGSRGELTEDISLVEAVGGDDCSGLVYRGPACGSDGRQGLTRHAQVGLGGEVGHGDSGALDGRNQVVGSSCRQDVKTHAPTEVGSRAERVRL